MIYIENRQETINVNIEQIKQSLNAILNILECQNKEISLLFVNDEQIIRINRDYMGRNCPTNVISFSMSEGEFGEINPDILGDIVISVETALRNANEENIDFEDEVEFLLIHGLLHLLGYNHENTSKNEAEIMHKKEQDIFCQLKGYLIE